MNGEQGFGPGSHGLLSLLRRHRISAVVDVDESGDGADRADRHGSRVPRVANRDNFVSRLDSGRQQCESKRIRATGHSDGISTIEIRRELLFKGKYFGA